MQILLEEDSRPVKKQSNKRFLTVNVDIIYSISDSQWVSLVYLVLKKARVTMILNDKGEEIHTRLSIEWQVCNDY